MSPIRLCERPIRSFAILAAIGASSLLAACGGSGGSGSGSAKAAAVSPADNALKFAKCMRERGVRNFPNPETSGGAVKLRFRVRPGEGPNPQTLEAAQRACRRYQAPELQNLTPQQRLEREEAGLKFAKCMREHGVNLPNPSISGGGIRIQGGPGGVNPASPAFEAAQKACQDLLPGLKGRPGGPPAGDLGVQGKSGGGGGPSLKGG
jgi:hypothetical protein